MYHHGGEIYGQEILYDFSVNVNPLGMPEQVNDFLMSREAVYYAGIYPQNGNDKLAEAIAKKEGVSRECIVCGNGASELIYALFASMPRGKVLLCAPGFYEYENAAGINGWEILFYETKEEKDFRIDDDILDVIEKSKPQLTVLCNPSNPVGNVIDPQLLERIVKKLAGQGGKLLVDECFLGFLMQGEKYSVKKYVSDDKVYKEYADASVVIVKAFTKLYAMPGLRLGYAIVPDEETAGRLKSILPEWNVSSIAQQAGLLALADSHYLNRTKDFIREERIYLSARLKDLGLKVYPGEANFILWKGVSGLKKLLQNEGILIRDCSNYKGLCETEAHMSYYRTAVKCRNENDILLDVLEKVL